MNIVLGSNTTQHGLGPLEHLHPVLSELFAGCSTVLFIGWAKVDGDAYLERIRPAFDAVGLTVVSAHDGASLDDADAVFVGGGNTFLLTHHMIEHDWMDLLRVRVMAGMPYLGTSAGANLACPTLCTTNDMPIVRPRTFETLGLIPFQLNAHYQEPVPGSTHQGETRAQRIAEYHEHNDWPVLGIREGTWLRLKGSALHLRGIEGAGGARLFRKGWRPQELEQGRDLTFLLTGE